MTPDRIEKASGASFALDREIANEVGSPLDPPRAYTASLDAAMTLVPDGYAWGIFDDGTAWVWTDQRRDLLTGFQVKAATPALALCSAALRARDAMEGGW